MSLVLCQNEKQKNSSWNTAHVLQKSDDSAEAFNLVPLKQIESEPFIQLPADTTPKTASSGCCSVRKLDTDVLQKTEEPKCFNLVPLQQLDSKPSIVQLPADTTAKAASSGSGCCPVRKLETHVEPSGKSSQTGEKTSKLVPLETFEAKSSAQLPLAKGSLEERSETLMQSDDT